MAHRKYDVSLNAGSNSAPTLLALIIGDRPGGAALSAAEEVLDVVGSVQGLLQATWEQLQSIRGIGPRRAARLLAALELGRRACERQSALAFADTPMSSPEDVDLWARPRLAHLLHEEVWLLSVDARGRLMRADRVAQGGVRACSLMPHDVLRPAVRNGATGAILVHNHPSGDPEPSADDIAMTQALNRSFGILGMVLLDHVVIGATCSTSIVQYAGLEDLAA